MSTPRRLAGLLATLFAGLVLATPAQPQTAYLQEINGGSDFKRFDLETGELTHLSDPPLDIEALAFDAEGRLFAIAKDATPQPNFEYRLYQADPQTGEFVLIAPLVVVLSAIYSWDMTFDEDGRLLAVFNGELHRIDPAGGTFELIGGSDLKAIALRRSQLWSIQGADSDDVWNLVTVDAATGESTFVAALTELPTSGSFWLDLQVDGLGRLWLQRTRTVFGQPPFSRRTSYYRIDDPPAGGLKLVIEETIGTFRAGFAIDRPIAPVAVPTLNRGPIAILVSLLIIAGLLVIRRRA